ncbi:FAD-dependent oxidoreductase [Bordetella holmesii]|uniref:NAD(P)-binding Rossmann-like domain protein n=2 Tax=Bordetella holmesii TaxID=35814 RepID=A0A158M0B4_9BORD|nr:FAD/NAD(P)-binding protein [Bordetella holmesii]AHV94494.1 FAD binding domain protein [Bordetella holmesii ATCC 51541]AIT28565.1 FAD binding domain protein [Bordetella holmesii 44057]EWM41353.1 FAD binding domain protein [Bordetella holmesii 35009]EWM43713.1 FAD binding domain protein [Bordetella holmesii 41130]EWM45249.1 FAD binding domain protein [Bordetella holmesii 70147]KAK88376.1 NAD(P)-binding Rossmann-like domain protein [Bordetella holmesii CDC-H585-BH]KAK89975.1 NAD(P)-binding R
MSPHNARIVIVGAGLSGLYAAYLLARQGVTDYVVLEAREAPGGRIASADASGQVVSHGAAQASSVDRFDLGPAWFWPGYQREL